MSKLFIIKQKGCKYNVKKIIGKLLATINFNIDKTFKKTNNDLIFEENNLKCIDRIQENIILEFEEFTLSKSKRKIFKYFY